MTSASLLLKRFLHVSRQISAVTNAVRPPTRPQLSLRIGNAQLINAKNSKFSSVQLRLEDDEDAIKIPLVWFRDHCRSNENYNSKTNQRRSDGTNFFEKAALAIDQNPIEFDPARQTLSIHWLDGRHSTFTTEEIFNWAVFTQKSYDECSSRTFWDAETLKAIPSVSSKSFDFAVFARLLVRFGVVAVLGVDARNEKATRKLCESVAPIQNTFFGDFWVFGTNAEQNSAEDREDTAYSNEEIGPHTDGSYFEQTPGIQVFHCLKAAQEGGETILVDGFSVAEKFRTRYPEFFHVLSRMPIEHHYLEGTRAPSEGAKLTNAVQKESLHARDIVHPVISLFKQKLLQIRFNPYDRAPLRSLRLDESVQSLEKTVQFYEAYESFARMVKEPRNAFHVKLEPGTAIFIDNYRVLHARTAFQGSRKMCGCYLSRDNFLAKARPVLSSVYENI